MGISQAVTCAMHIIKDCNNFEVTVTNDMITPVIKGIKNMFSVAL